MNNLIQEAVTAALKATDIFQADKDYKFFAEKLNASGFEVGTLNSCYANNTLDIESRMFAITKADASAYQMHMKKIATLADAAKIARREIKIKAIVESSITKLIK